MATLDPALPDHLPVLSRGKHRNPRRGACFMELASYLAGERWSDHPACTHPLLAAVAREVNDHTPDDARPRLAVLIPSVIGLTSDDPHVDVLVARRCATTALPVVSAERQRVLAVGLLACERMLDELDDRPLGTLGPETRTALEHVPHAARWARRFSGQGRGSLRGFQRHAAPSIVHTAVAGLAAAAIPDPAGRLHDLLVATIDECAAFAPGDRGPAAVPTRGWDDAVALTGTVAER